jgi:hypothetical protein
MILVSSQLVMGGYYSKNISLGLIDSTQTLHFYQHYSSFGEKTRGLCPCMFSMLVTCQ